MSDLSVLIGDVPGVGSPAARALAEQGLTTLGQLDGADWSTLAQLHGVGPAAGRRLQAALAEHGASMKNPPAPDTRRSTYSRGATGKVAKDIVTHPTEVTPAQFLDTLEGRRAEEGRRLLEIFDEVTGEKAVMWGPTMIGYGSYHYRYASGREGNAFRLGFSPRRANLALYGVQQHPSAPELLEELGTHKVGVGCVWVTRLENIDLDVLRELAARSWSVDPADY